MRVDAAISSAPHRLWSKGRECPHRLILASASSILQPGQALSMIRRGVTYSSFDVKAEPRDKIDVSGKHPVAVKELGEADLVFRRRGHRRESVEGDIHGKNI
jgi:hypothetical protein